MTYCVGLKLNEGLVFLSDTRTNAGIDSVSRFRKSFRYSADDRAIVVMTAGNLSITQGVISQLEASPSAARGEVQGEAQAGAQGKAQVGAQGEAPVEAQGGAAGLLTAVSLYQVAELTGARMRALLERHGPAIEKEGVASGASMIIGGQIRGERPRMFLVYSAGNFIECEPDTPYFQIGETKYGKPILDRTISSQTTLAEGVRTALVSMDLTVRSNLSVGLPLDLTVIRSDECRIGAERRIERDTETYAAISAGWADALKNALAGLPSVDDWLA